ncbi:rhomboid family intramembrane serine protease [Pseudoxanthomonas sp.]|jgi:membrane associated rhomboid family serine protease|uniref:rhomboid family intramembrane serine protease n=1 Tax=Pseudoxanthomonas sp. TaxID=1871049 RepID=UPI003F7E825E
MFPPVLPVTRALLIANVVVFLLQMFLGDAVTAPFMQWPIDFTGVGTGDGGFMLWQPLTSGFMHGGPGHLFFNMLALWMFGSPLEATWGEKRFTTYYFVCLIGANLCQLLVSSWALASGGYAIPSLGASGAIFGLLLGYGMLFPNQRMIVFPIPMEIRARTLVIIYGVLALFFGITGTQAGVAHFAHLGGMIFGWLMIRYWRGQPPFGKRRPPGPRMRIVK